MRRKVCLLALTVLLLLSSAISVSAAGFDSTKTGSITLTVVDQNSKQPVVGAKFDVYYIASVGINSNKKLSYIYSPDFENSDIALDDSQLAAKLSAYVEGKNLTPQRIVIDAKGVATCSNLPLGLYLMKQVDMVEGYSSCNPFVIPVPKQEGNSFVYDVNAKPKSEIVKLVSITIKKVWNAGKSTIPSSIEVELLRDGKVVETAKLNKGNNWKIVYNDMPESDRYSINEVDVPKGFTDTYSKSGWEFTVTNTASLAQTGQLVWPIPVFALAGILFLMAGFVILRKPGKQNA